MPIADSRITEEQIHTLVHGFYGRIRTDGELGPIFEKRFAGRWDAHLSRMCDFWSTVMLASGRYRGNPLESHRRIPELRSVHFDRWLALFGEVAHEVLPLHIARDVEGRAQRMRAVLERHLPTTPSPASTDPGETAAPPRSRG
ncbi:group III truncated hemoglobin [Gaopeijia maritima]|uniref:group III truncated hemoglobin n=1 Tax=Gaopeijia maritima TaxID=3119007 RepID=UPI003250AF2E